MANLFNRAKMTTATTGAGTITLGSASAGYQSFADAGVTNGVSVRYVIEDGANWEIGVGTYTSSGTTLSRGPSQSTNSGAAIVLSGSAAVFISAVSEDLVPYTSGTPIAVSVGGTGVSTSTGSGAVVLGTGPTITGAALNGTVGATTPSTGAFTTVTASTSVLSSGTGGVGYSTGAGVAVTQLTSRTTAAPTTGNSKSGAVTLFTTTAVVGTYFSFTVPNTGIAVTDTVVLTVRGATNTYVASVTAIVAATSFQVTMASVVGTASDTPVVNFTIIKGVSA